MANRKLGEPRDVNAILTTHFEKCAELVQRYTDMVISALVTRIREFEVKLIAMTFVTILFTLPILPILSFVGIPILVMSSVVYCAAGCAVSACLAAESVILWMTRCTLRSRVLIAVFATTFLLSVYLPCRFILLVQFNGLSGVTEWVTEAKQCFLPKRERERPDGPDVAIQHPK
ncbi:hypothetical protein BKA82DRAFT_1009015 [Pisolithus tinctorius]|uniref:Uncharacterized protein n=1 Tax=Pisolithus tinctorius Marx 270 TaxID=870435 RepID=A0A0C3NC11_PISTI|nr:hypothetical protein BKA82DRAFT_1009015 [Pisolithus tinctorius]KIN93350.1 hypothetical protein M404DRAFT_1009015 [Pisolithus tinctorius Marx 270]